MAMTHLLAFLLFLTLCALLQLVLGATNINHKNQLLKHRINNLKLQECVQNSSYPLTVSDVQIQFTDNWGLLVNGTLNSRVNLDQAIQADINVKRYVVLEWVPVPCFKSNVGSCSYQDLCAFGVPKGKNCPQDFIEQRVPCRCPVRKGTYTLHMKTESLLGGIESIYDGSYKGNILLKHDNSILSCYNFWFDLREKDAEPMAPSVVLIR